MENEYASTLLKGGGVTHNVASGKLERTITFATIARGASVGQLSNVETVMLLKINNIKWNIN